MRTVVFVLGLVLAALAAAPLLREHMREEARRRVKREENRALYGAVSGKVMVPRGDRWDIVEPNPGIIPEGTVVLIQSSAFDPPEPFGVATMTWEWENYAAWWPGMRYVPVLPPTTPITITEVT